jgi:predicted RNA polymerase sigma factor
MRVMVIGKRARASPPAPRRAGRLAEVRPQFEAAAKLTQNAREAAFLLARAAACG